MEMCSVALSELPIGETRLATTESGRLILLVRTDATVRAFQGTCTHEGTEFEQAYIANGVVTCPAHYSQFDARTGEVLEPPADRSLNEYQTELRDGSIFIGSPIG